MFNKLKESFKKTSLTLSQKISSIFNKNKNIDEIVDELEETLILSDVSVMTSSKICDNLRKKVKSSKDKSEENIKNILKSEIVEIFNNQSVNKKDKVMDADIQKNNKKKIILVVGVNGVGKTTSIGKLANMYTKSSSKVLVAAADTFRAGAVEQLDIWANKAKCDIYKGKTNEDPSSVIFDATKKYMTENYDILICDTAGRLQNKKNLMDELEKMKKTIDKNAPNISKEVLIVLDATTGQNAVSQVKNFYDKTQVNGIILTKLDSTSKGGVIITIADELKMPVKYIGFGENMDDFDEFNAQDFVTSLI